MAEQSKNFALQTVPDMLVASIRFTGEFGAVAEPLADLLHQAAGQITGPALCLYHESNPTGGYDMEVCVPVEAPITTHNVTSRMLPGGVMATSTHTGPPDTIRETWRLMYRLAGDANVAFAEGPGREVYLEQGPEHADKTSDKDTANDVIQVMHPALQPLWLDRLRNGLDQHVDTATRDQIMAGHGDLRPDDPPEVQAAWAKNMIDRLDDTIPNEAARQQIMTGCAHVFPAGRIAYARAEYERLDGDIDALLTFLHADPVAYFSTPRREGNRIITSKNPYDRQGYETATTAAEKQAAYCHCPMIKAAIRDETGVSGTYCYCGSGWFSRLWGGILDQPVAVEVLESVLQGDERCTFAVLLPEEVVPAEN